MFYILPSSSVPNTSKGAKRNFIFELRNPGEGNGQDEEWTTEEIKKKILLTCSSVITSDSVETFISELRKVVLDKKDIINVVFAVPAKQGYGVWIGQIQASSNEDGSKYMFLRYEYENFEDSSKTFFDGQR